MDYRTTHHAASDDSRVVAASWRKRYVLGLATSGLLLLVGTFGVTIAHAAPLTFSATTVSLTSPAVNFTIASGSIADALTVNATSVLVSLSSSGGNSFTLTSASADLLVSASAGGGTDPVTCLNSGLTGVNGVDQLILTQETGSAVYTITPGGTTCLNINSNHGGITIYPIVIHAPSYASTTVGTTLTIPVTATDPNGYPVTLAATALPSNASFSTSTYDLAWSPQSAGTASATILASDKVTQTTSTIALEAFGLASSANIGGSGTNSGSMSGASASSTSNLSIAALKAEIASLEQEVQNLLAELKSRGLTAPAVSSGYAFARNLTMGSRGDDVHALQLFLIRENTGPAARKLKAHGMTHFFWTLTRNALAEYQKSVGITPPLGYFGPITRGYVSSIPSQASAP